MSAETQIAADELARLLCEAFGISMKGLTSFSLTLQADKAPIVNVTYTGLADGQELKRVQGLRLVAIPVPGRLAEVRQGHWRQLSRSPLRPSEAVEPCFFSVNPSAAEEAAAHGESNEPAVSPPNSTFHFPSLRTIHTGPSGDGWLYAGELFMGALRGELVGVRATSVAEVGRPTYRPNCSEKV